MPERVADCLLQKVTRVPRRCISVVKSATSRVLLAYPEPEPEFCAFATLDIKLRKKSAASVLAHSVSRVAFARVAQHRVASTGETVQLRLANQQQLSRLWSFQSGCN